METEKMIDLKKQIAALIFEYEDEKDHIRPTERAACNMADRIMDILADYTNLDPEEELPISKVLETKHPEDADCSDFILLGISCWIEVGEIVAYIRNDGGGINIEIHPNFPNAGDGSPLAELSYTKP